MQPDTITVYGIQFKRSYYWGGYYAHIAGHDVILRRDVLKCGDPVRPVWGAGEPDLPSGLLIHGDTPEQALGDWMRLTLGQLRGKAALTAKHLTNFETKLASMLGDS